MYLDAHASGTLHRVPWLTLVGVLCWRASCEKVAEHDNILQVLPGGVMEGRKLSQSAQAAVIRKVKPAVSLPSQVLVSGDTIDFGKGDSLDFGNGNGNGNGNADADTPADTPGNVAYANQPAASSDAGKGVDNQPIGDPDGNAADAVSTDESLNDKIEVESKWTTGRMVVAILLGTGITAGITLIFGIIAMVASMGYKRASRPKDPPVIEEIPAEEAEPAETEPLVRGPRDPNHLSYGDTGDAGDETGAF